VAALQHVLERAYERRAAVLVLPELRMPPPLLEATRQFLRRQAITSERGILVVAAGSWHIDMPGGRRFNRCVVLDHEGEDLWLHDKLREYEITAQNVADKPDFYRPIGVGPGGAVEAIHRGQELQFYDSIIGRLAAAICVGFFSPDVQSLLLASGANLFLVPAMTPSITAIEACSEALVHTQLAYTLAANCGIVGPQAKSFCRWPAGRDAVRSLDADKTLLTLDLNNTSIYDVD
jgi:predicted amidohydrolase